MPEIEYHDKRRCHVFKCAAHSCKHKLLGRTCLTSTMASGSTEAARDRPIKSLLETGSIKTAFTQKGKGKVTYSHHQHTHAKTRGFNNLMETGHPEYYLPSPSTVSCDVKQVFIKTCKHIANMLQNYDGELNFATDAWTSPNHRAFVAILVHLEHEGQPLAMILNIVEVSKVKQLTIN
ncbi:hypothetical protein BDR07DRAFT_1447216 [Suillus spraguei]|nr:hypothetical protein BDR07DRAFT_1447216 [Suillus spraguei]